MNACAPKTSGAGSHSSSYSPALATNCYACLRVLLGALRYTREAIELLGLLDISRSGRNATEASKGRECSSRFGLRLPDGRLWPELSTTQTKDLQKWQGESHAGERSSHSAGWYTVVLDSCEENGGRVIGPIIH